MGATPPLWIPAFAGMTNSVAGTIHSRTNQPCRPVPAHQGMRIGGAGWGKRLSVICATHNPSPGFPLSRE